MFKVITPEQAGIPSSEISRYIDYLNENSLSTHSLLMMKGDCIFTEAYWKPFHKDFCHRQYSQTKSFVGIAIGLLVSDGKLSLDDRIVDLFSEKIDAPENIPDRLRSQTVGQMLTMTTSLSCRMLNPFLSGSLWIVGIAFLCILLILMLLVLLCMIQLLVMK